MRSVIAAERPDYVFHLAAVLKAESLHALLAVNVIGTQHVLDAVAAVGEGCRVMVAGSAAEYGLARAEELPIREDNPLRPVTSYGVSKVAQSVLAARYATCDGLPVIRTRTFNLTGPAEPDMLVCAGFARQIVEIERGTKAPILRTGSLDARRDFVDIRDAVRAYWLLARQGEPGEVYNVCSGVGTPIKRVLEILLEMSPASFAVEQRSEAHPASNVPFQVGSAEKTRAATDWRPRVPLEESLAALLRTRRSLREEESPDVG